MERQSTSRARWPADGPRRRAHRPEHAARLLAADHQRPRHHQRAVRLPRRRGVGAELRGHGRVHGLARRPLQPHEGDRRRNPDLERLYRGLRCRAELRADGRRAFLRRERRSGAGACGRVAAGRIVPRGAARRRDGRVLHGHPSRRRPRLPARRHGRRNVRLAQYVHATRRHRCRARAAGPRC